MVFLIKNVQFFIPDYPSSLLLRFIRFSAPSFQKIGDDQLKYTKISLKNDLPHEEKLLTLRLQSMLVWISICNENHALRAWREITWIYP